MKSKLEIATNVSIILVALTATAALVKNHLLPPPRAELPSPVAAGDRLESLTDLAPEHAERTLFIALSPNCSFCTESLPFYRTIRQRRDDTGSDVRIVAVVTPGSAAAQEELLQDVGVDVDRIIETDLHELRIIGTPTLLLAGRDGTVLDLWHGKLDQQAQERVLASIS